MKPSSNKFQGRLREEPALSFLSALEKKFKEAEIFLVGGMVRDIILGHPSKDYDFVIRGLAPKKLEKFLEEHGRVNLVGRTFGVYKFSPDRSLLLEPIDIALPRTEHALGTGGYRDFEIQSDPALPIEKDLARRDFTMNAIAYDIRKNKLVDPFDGKKDLKAKLIRAVGKPEERFGEDYSRMLRAIRFATQFDFWIEEHTWAAIKKLIPKINATQKNKLTGETERIVPQETIAKEFIKSLCANPTKTMELYDITGAAEELMPELLAMKGVPQPKEFHSEGDVWEHTRISLEVLNSKKFKKQFPGWQITPELIFTVLIHDIGKPPTIETPEKDKTDRIRFDEHAEAGAEIAKKIAERLALANMGVKPERVYWLVKNHLLLLNVNEMKNSTIEKYFFDKDTGDLSQAGRNLLMLYFADVSATIPPSGKPDFTSFKTMLRRIKALKTLTKEKVRLPKPLLNGNEIMKALKLKSGPKIGELLNLLREEQLAGKIKNKKDGLKFLRGIS